MKNKGVTLIELIIIVAIIGILFCTFTPQIVRYFAEQPSKPITNSQGLR